MNLYLDLNKAVQIPSTGTDARSETRSSRTYKESFARTHSGVTGGDATPDKPEVGKQWRAAGDDSSLDDELEDDRKRDTEIAADRGVVSAKKKDEKDEGTQKALDILKSLSAGLSEQLNRSLPNEREVEYLTSMCGYDHEEIAKGTATISGHERAKFNSWLQNRLRKSIDRLVSR